MLKKWPRLPLLLVSLLLAAGLAVGCGGEEGQPGATELSGTLNVNGSTTVTPIAQGWAEAFNEANPEVNVIISGAGSGNGIASLINGTTDIAMTSRDIKDGERSQIVGEVKEYVIGLDALAIITHTENPVESLSLAQLKDIFTGKINNWKDVGGNDAEILVYTRDNSAGTYEYFKESVLAKEEFAVRARSASSNASMASSIAQEETAIGFVGLAFVDSKVKTLPVSAQGQEVVEPTVKNAKSGAYPIARALNMYTIGEAEGLAKAYLDFGLSDEGQEIITAAGYIPVN